MVIDADGATPIPGLIDSQVHNTFGDYTPRQKTVGFLESYVHGGVTTAISASEVHVPGRPKDPEGVKALAVAAMKCFEHYRPGGMRVWGGSVIMEPGLTEADFKEIAAKGVWLAKAGFGSVKTPYDYEPMIAWAKKRGMVTMVHTGGSSIPGSSGIWADHLLAIKPDVSFHVNGGPVAMPDRDFPRIVNESKIALQVCTAGNLRTTLLLGDLVRKAGQFDRFLIATDTPTGSGIMPLGMLYTISHLASLTDMPVEWAIAAATGNNARVYRLNSGFLKARLRCRRSADRCLRRRLERQCARRPAQRRYRRRRARWSPTACRASSAAAATPRRRCAACASPSAAFRRIIPARRTEHRNSRRSSKCHDTRTTCRTA